MGQTGCELHARDALERFDISKYAQSSSLSILDWNALISHRAPMVWSGDRLRDARMFRRVNSFIRRIELAPLSVLGLTRSAYGPSVEPLSVDDAYALQSTIQAYMPQLAQQIEELAQRHADAREFDLSDDADVELLLRQVDEDRRLEEGLDVPYDEKLKAAGVQAGDRAHIVVEMDAPDDVIIEHFREWLKKHREANGKVPGISETDVRKWSQHRVLPYLDLVILSKIANVQLTNFEIGCKLFSDMLSVDVAEKVRKTTAPLAERLVGDGYAQVSAKANSELRRQNGRNWGDETFRKE